MNKSKRGDTIIEVMLSMAIIGLVLAAAYTTASTNLRTSRFTQERTEALKVAESQIEFMKSLEDVNRTNLFTQGTDFCLSASSVPVFQPGGSAACTRGFYSYFIQRSGDIFITIVRWTPPGGIDSNKAEVKLTYRYPQ
ncbi:MAG: prepilin-type N-terminal cleavage/methylation domain-containing protein [bacterium]|nr:prepilin-type N-terminal cleavage/methylation domain-containing protein [bacterium]